MLAGPHPGEIPLPLDSLPVRLLMPLVAHAFLHLFTLSTPVGRRLHRRIQRRDTHRRQLFGDRLDCRRRRCREGPCRWLEQRGAGDEGKQVARRLGLAERGLGKAHAPGLLDASREGAPAYKITDAYKEGALLVHPQFGLGVVSKVISTRKMEVIFESSKKLMAMNVSSPQ